MIAGFAALEDLTGVRRRVIGIDASATLEKTTDQVARIARHTADLIELGRDLRDDEITVLEGWAGDLYGVPVDSTMEAMALGAQLEAMITDPVYEGKSLAGLIDLVKDGDIPPRLPRALRPPRRPAGDQRLPLALARAGLASPALLDVPPRSPGPDGRRLAGHVGTQRLDGGMTSRMLALHHDDGSESVLRLMTNEPWRTHGAELTDARARRPSSSSPGPTCRRRRASRSTRTAAPAGWRHT